MKTHHILGRSLQYFVRNSEDNLQLLQSKMCGHLLVILFSDLPYDALALRTTKAQVDSIKFYGNAFCKIVSHLVFGSIPI